MELKELKVENKKDRVEDLHPSTKHMLQMASATESDQTGKPCNTFKTFFDSKNHVAANIQLCQLMEDKGLGNVIFGREVFKTLWSGNFARANLLAPGLPSPFSFKEMEPFGSSQRKRSLLLSKVLNAKGDLLKSLEEMKALPKVETTILTDYYGFIYQIKTYKVLIGIVTGKSSLASVQLENFN